MNSPIQSKHVHLLSLIVSVSTSFCMSNHALSAPEASAASSASLSIKPDALLQIDTHRSAMVARIVEGWKGEIPAAQIASFRSKLMALRADQLLAANVSGTLEGVLEIISAQEKTQDVLIKNTTLTPASVEIMDRAKVLGDVTRDLVYTPVTPCRFFDSRNAAGGKIIGGTTRDYFTFAASFQSQGGVASNCNIDAGAVALAINVVMVNQDNAGYATVFAAGTPIPPASHINFPEPSVQPEANFGIFPICTSGCPGGKGISIFTSATSNVLADVVGYFARPQATALDCIVTEGAPVDVPANGYAGVPRPQCPTSYTRIYSSFRNGLNGLVRADENSASIYLRNTSSAINAALPESTCCRINGR
jgi:hypothetical protein